MTTPSRWILLAVLTHAVGLAMPALAQNALGDGRALEKRNVRKYPQSVEPRGGRDFAAEVRFRNSIVTGDAPGGLSFRGSAPYTSPNSFRGLSAADDLYSFRRDSYFSGLAGQGIRGTEALQYQFSMTTGSAPPRGITGSLGVGRFGDPAVTGVVRDTRVQDEVAGADWVRSPSSYATSRALKPTAVGERPDPSDAGSVYRLMSSPLLGLKVQKVNFAAQNDPRAQDGRTPPPGQALPGQRPGDTPGNTVTPGGENPGQRPQDATTDQKQAPYSTSYDKLTERLGSWKRPGETRPATGNQQASPNAPLPNTPLPNTPGARPTPEAGTRPLPYQRRLDALRRHLLGLPPREVDQGDVEPLGTDDAVSKLNPDTVTMIRESGVKVDRFLEVPDARASLPIYARAMAGGQTAMGEERYFDAEDRFSRALAVRTRDPAAQAARIHAQLGAGMYLSASMNLREMIVANPESAAIRYDVKLLPAATRAAEIVATLRTRLKNVEQSDPLARSLGDREVGFLLAYLGYQLGDEGAIKDGLTAVAAVSGESEDAQMSGRIERYLRAVWLGEVPTEMPAAPESAPPPAPAPAAATPSATPPATPPPAASPPSK